MALRLILPDHIVQFFGGADARIKRSSTTLLKLLFGRVSYLDYWFGHLLPMFGGREFTVREQIAFELVQRFASRYYGSAIASSGARDTDLHAGEPQSARAVAIALGALEISRQQFKSQKNVDVLWETWVRRLIFCRDTFRILRCARTHGRESRAVPRLSNLSFKSPP